MTKQRVSVSATKTIVTYVYLFNAADCMIEQAKATEKGRFYNCMSANVLLAFCLEAYLNHIGKELLNWDDKVKRHKSPQYKLDTICHQVQLAPDYLWSPFKSFKQIFEFRNQTAHGETVSFSVQEDQILLDGERVKTPENSWEQQCDLNTSLRWLSDTQSMITSIHKATGKSDPFSSQYISKYICDD